MNLLDDHSSRVAPHWCKLPLQWIWKLAMAAVVLGATHAAAQSLQPGTVTGWGSNQYGQIAIPADLGNVVQISTGSIHGLALRSDGTVVSWGDNSLGQTDVPGGLKAKAIAAGSLHNLAVTSEGSVVGWGYNYHGETTVPQGLDGVIAVAAGGYHSLALKSDGTVVGWGDNQFGQATPPPGLTGVKQIAAGGYFSLALRNDGSVVAWGHNIWGQLDLPPGLSDVQAIAAGAIHALALKSDGTVVSWGGNYLGQATTPTGLAGVKAIAAGADAYHSLAVKQDGTVVAWGWNWGGQTDVPASLRNVNAIAAGWIHSLAANVIAVHEAYTFTGFLPPISGPPAVNRGKAGRTFPLKWQLRDASGNFVSALSSVRSITSSPARCGGFGESGSRTTSTDPSGGSELRYDRHANQFVFNWKTPASPGCYTITLTLDSGQVQQAYFHLT